MNETEIRKKISSNFEIGNFGTENYVWRDCYKTFSKKDKVCCTSSSGGIDKFVIIRRAHFPKSFPSPLPEKKSSFIYFT